MVKNIAGFTIVEALVAVTIFAVLGIISIDLLTKTFQNNNKARLITKIKQNGQVALNTIDDYLREANSVVCNGDFNTSDTNLSDTIVTVKNSFYTRIRFNFMTSLNNGSINVDNPTVTTQVPSTLCTDPQTSPTNLTDINTTNGVSVVSGNFKLDRSPGFKDLVTVLFTLGPPLNAANRFDTKIDPIPFQTTIILR